MLTVLQDRLQQYVNRELPDVQAGFRKGRGTRDQIANIRWIMEKATEFQKNIYFCFIDYAKAFDYVDHDNHTELLEVFLLYTGCFHASVPLLQLLSLPGRYPAHPVWETPTQLSK